MDVIRQKATNYMNSVAKQPMPQPAQNTTKSSSSVSPVTTFITALPGIAALILVLMRTSSTASTLSNGGFTTGVGSSLFTSANVGIGTNNPAGKLQVVGNAYITTGNLGVGTISTPSKLTVLETGAVNAYVTTIRGTNNQNNGLLIDLLNDDGNVDLLRMRSNTSSKFAVYSDGAVEIGNTLEDGELTVYGSLVVDSNNPSIAVAQFIQSNSSANSSLLIDAHGSANDGMFLTSSGKMVVGTVSQAALSTTLSAPYKLQVFGDINIVGNVYNNGNLTGGSGGGTNLVVVSEYLPNLTVGGTLNVEQEIRSNNFLTVVKDTMIGGNLTVMNQTALNGNLTVSGQGRFNDIFVTSDIFFNGNIYQDGELFGAANTGTVTGVTKYSDVNTIVLAATDTDWVSDSAIYQEGRTITTSALGAYLEKTFLITREGTYILNVNYLLGPDFGYATLMIDGLALTVNSEPQVSEIDLYSPWGSTTPNMVISYTVSLNTGTHTIRIENKSNSILQNPLSGGYRVGLGDSTLVYIPVAKSPTQVETRISINSLKPEDSTGGWQSINSNLTSLTNGLILTSGAQFDGFYRDISITVEGSYLMNFLFPMDPSYGKVFIELIGPAGGDSVNTPLDIVDLYTAVGGAGSSRILKSYSKTLSTGTYRLRISNPGTKNGSSVGYRIGAGEVSLILINAGLSSFGTVIFSTLKGDVIENDADGWVGSSATNLDKGGFSKFTPTTGFLNYITPGTYEPYSNVTTDFLNMKVMNDTDKTVYIAYVERTTGFLFVKRLANIDVGGVFEWIALPDKKPNPSYGLPDPAIEQDHVVTNDDQANNNINFSTQYVSLAVRKIGIVEYIYVAYIQQQDIYSEADADNINTSSALDSKVRVKRYVASGAGAPYWEFVSYDPQNSPAISEGPAAHLSLQIDSMGSPVIAYSNLESYDKTSSNANKLVVQRWNNSQSSWEYIVDETFSLGITNQTTTSSSSINMDTLLPGDTLTLTIVAGLSFFPNDTKVKVYRTSDANKYFVINITSYSSTTLEGTILSKVGTGTYTTWTLSVITDNLTAVAKNGVTPSGAYFNSMALGKTNPNYVRNNTDVVSTTSTTSINMGGFNVGDNLSLVTAGSGLTKTLDDGTIVSRYPEGCRLKVYYTLNTNKYFIISVVSYSLTTLQGTILEKQGAETYSSWTIDYAAKSTMLDQLYVAFSDGASRTTTDSLNIQNGLSVFTYEVNDVLHYHKWSYIGPVGSQGSVDHINLMVFDNEGTDELFVGFEDLFVNAGSVVQFVPGDSTADPPTVDSWNYVGQQGFTEGPVHNLVMDARKIDAVPSGAPWHVEIYVGYRDGRDDPLGDTYKNRMSIIYYNKYQDYPGLENDIWNYITATFDPADYITTSATRIDLNTYTTTSTETIDLSAQTIGGSLIPFEFNIPANLNYADSILNNKVAIFRSIESSDYIQVLVNSYNRQTGDITGTVMAVSGTAAYSRWNVSLYRGKAAATSTTSVDLSAQVVDGTSTAVVVPLSSVSGTISAGDIARIALSTDSTKYIDILITNYTVSSPNATIVGRILAVSGTTTHASWVVDIYNSIELVGERVFVNMAADKPFTDGDTMTLTSGSVVANLSVVAKTGTVIEGVVDAKGVDSITVANNYSSTWSISLSSKGSIDSRHFTSGPVSDTAMVIRDFDTPVIMTIYRQGQPIIYHGSYITIFDEITDNPGLYPQPANDTFNGFGLEYEYFFPFTTSYRITVEYILGEEFGVSRLRLNGVVIGDQVDCYLEDSSPKLWTRTVSYTVSLFAGTNTIRLENAGSRNASSSGYNIGVASVRIEYFSVTRDGDMDNLTVTGNASFNVATINSLSVANFTGVETLTLGTENNSLLRLGNAINPSTSLPVPMATVAISDTAQDLTFTNNQTAGGIDFKLTTLFNSGLSTGTAMKLSRYGRLGVGVDIDNVSVAFGVSANLISGNLAYLENTNIEGNGLYIKTASTDRHRYPLYIVAGSANTMVLTSDGYLGLGVNPSDMVRELTVAGNTAVNGGILDLGNSAVAPSYLTMSGNKATVAYSGTNLAIRTNESASSITLAANNSFITLNDANQTISTNNLQINSRNTAKAWLHIPAFSGTLSVDSSFNIQAISRIRAGVYSVRMTTPISTNKYAVVASTDSTNGNLNAMVNISSDYIFVIVIRDNFNTEKDPGALSCVVYGV